MIPSMPSIETHTKRQFHRGQMRNGVHEGGMINLEVIISVWENTESISCASCGAIISCGDLIGDGFITNDGRHCADCIEIPAGIEAWSITYRLRRRSIKHPDGMKSMMVANTPEQISKLTVDLSAAYGTIYLRKLYPSIQQEQSGAYQNGLLMRKAQILTAGELSPELQSELIELQGHIDCEG